MTTPTFAGTNASLSAVRLYTASDPYFYTVDNRPLTDMTGNDGLIGTSTDAARRAAMLNTLIEATRHQFAYGVTTPYIQGLAVTAPASNTARVDVGTYYQPLAISASDSRIIMKQATHPATQDFAINTVSLTGGQSVIYVIEAQANDFAATTPGTFPIYDNTNTYLPSTSLSQELRLQINPGVAATTGSQVAPSVTPGWFQLYLITVNGGAPTTYSSVVYPTAPSFNSWGMGPTAVSLTNSTSTTVVNGDLSTTNYATASTQLALSSLMVVNNQPVPVINPYKPIKFKLQYVGTTTSATNVAFQVKYQVLSPTSVINTPSYTTNTSDITTLTGYTANTLGTLTLTNGVVPALGGLNITTAERILLGFSRISTGDTYGGAFQVVSIEAFQ